MVKKTKRPLTIKQRKFIDEVVISWNATDAAIKAGYKAKNRNTAHAIGAENIQKPTIKAEIEDRLEVAKKMIYTLATTAEKEEIRLRASQDIVDRNEGKPIQRVIQDTKVSIDIEKASPEELLQLIKK